jgi:hypothetical protein
MTTPKKRRLRGKADPKQLVQFEPVLLDERFDKLDQANAEWAAWKWPRRDDAENI